MQPAGALHAHNHGMTYAMPCVRHITHVMYVRAQQKRQHHDYAQKGKACILPCLWLLTWYLQIDSHDLLRAATLGHQLFTPTLFQQQIFHIDKNDRCICWNLPVQQLQTLCTFTLQLHTWLCLHPACDTSSTHPLPKKNHCCNAFNACSCTLQTYKQMNRQPTSSCPVYCCCVQAVQQQDLCMPMPLAPAQCSSPHAGVPVLILCAHSSTAMTEPCFGSATSKTPASSTTARAPAVLPASAGGTATCKHRAVEMHNLLH